MDPGRVGGAENYLTNILKGLVENGYKDNVRIVIDRGMDDKYDPVFRAFSSHQVEVKYSRRLHDLFLNFYDAFNGIDTLFSPQYVLPLRKPRPGIDFITTIHDLQYRHYPELTHPVKRKWLYFTQLHALRIARKVVCISEFVRDDILEKFGNRHAEKLLVIPNPIDFRRFEHEPRDKTYRYILSVNSLYPHKNTLSLIEAYKLLKKSDPSAPKLVLVGQLPAKLIGNNYSSYHQKLIPAIQNDPDIVLTGYVNDAELGWWYAHADLFVNPSLFEGFGMTAVEAMGHGIPTITSSKTSLREVTLGKAIYLKDPVNPKDIAKTMSETLNDLTAHQKVFAAYPDLIRNTYSVEKIGKRYTDLFES